jgi:hypothetical protein
MLDRVACLGSAMSSETIRRTVTTHCQCSTRRHRRCVAVECTIDSCVSNGLSPATRTVSTVNDDRMCSLCCSFTFSLARFELVVFASRQFDHWPRHSSRRLNTSRSTLRIAPCIYASLVYSIVTGTMNISRRFSRRAIRVGNTPHRSNPI